MSDLVLDASLALQWFVEDEAGRQYSLSVLASLSSKRAVVPILWFYEVGNGLLMAYRRKIDVSMHYPFCLKVSSLGDGGSACQARDRSERS